MLYSSARTKTDFFADDSQYFWNFYLTDVYLCREMVTNYVRYFLLIMYIEAQKSKLRVRSKKNSNKIDEDFDIFVSFSIDFARIFPISPERYNFKIFGKIRPGSVETSITFVLFWIDSSESKVQSYRDLRQFRRNFSEPCRARNFETSRISKIFTYEQRILNLSFCLNRYPLLLIISNLSLQIEPRESRKITLQKYLYSAKWRETREYFLTNPMDIVKIQSNNTGRLFKIESYSLRRIGKSYVSILSMLVARSIV